MIKIKNKKFLKIIIGIFLVIAASFGIATSFFLPHQIYKNGQNQLKTNQVNNNNLGFLKENSANQETHIKGCQLRQYLNVIWASHEENGEEKESFYLSGYIHSVEAFSQAEDAMVQDGVNYKRINLSSILPKNEYVQGFDLGDANWMSWGWRSSMVFWTKNQYNKYHIYTAGNSNNSIARDTKKTPIGKFAKIVNPNKKNINEQYDFDKVKNISINYSNMGIWTQDIYGNDNIYFSGKQEYGQFGLDSQKSYFNKIIDATKNIFSSIGLEKKIKNVYFENAKANFILTSDNKIFDAGKNSKREIQGDSAQTFISKFTIVDTSMLRGANIKQMSVQESSHNTNPSLMVVTDNNQLWVMGFNPRYKKEKNEFGKVGNKFGVETPKYFGYLKQVPLNKIVSAEETFLYAISYGNYRWTGDHAAPTDPYTEVAYSILITKTNSGKNKIYMCGGSNQYNSCIFESSDKKNYGWAYNDELTKKIFGGEDKNSGIHANFNIYNLGNTSNSRPISLTSTSIIVNGTSNKDKDTKYQEQVLFVRKNVTSWNTLAINEPTIDNNSMNILEEIDPLDNKKYSLTYSFDIKTLKNKIDYKHCFVEPPWLKFGNEKYEFKRGNDKGEGVKVIISDISISKSSTFNDEWHKFILQVSFKDEKQQIHSKKIINYFSSVTIKKPIKIKKFEYEKIIMNKDSFTLSFFIEKELNGHILNGSYGEKHLLFNAKLKENSNLKKLGAKLKLKKYYDGVKTFFKLTVYNLPKKKAKYYIDDSIYLEASYSDLNNKKIGWGTWKSSEDNDFNFGVVNFDPLFFIPPALSSIQIILIISGSIIFTFIFSGTCLGLLRKKDSKAFAKYEAEKINSDPTCFGLSIVTKNRTKKQTREAIKKWKKQMKQDKKLNN